MHIGHHGKLIPLFVLLIAVTFLLKGLGAFDQNFVDIVWPVLLGITALIAMGGK
jgi:hypothetical protein